MAGRKGLLEGARRSGVCFPRAILTLLLIAVPGLAVATEGALGRPIAGTGVTANVGVVPPQPIWAVNFSEIYFNASISGSRPVPISGRTSLGLDTTISFSLATLLKVWDTGPGKWNFASSLTIPYAKVLVEGTLTINTLPVQVTQTESDAFDLFFTPITAGYHVSENENFSVSLGVWAPTGHYDVNSGANTSLNNWTFIPTFSYTKTLPEHGLEFDATTGVQFYSRNNATRYQNAPLWTLDVMGLKRFANGWGAGLIIGTVQQLDDDTGPTANALNGFVGHEWNAGPIATYDTKLAGKAPLGFSLRWVPSIETDKRLSGDTVMATATLIF